MEKVNHPNYYQFGKSEVIDIARELTYNCGVALAYVARSGRADDSLIKVEEGMTPNEKRIEDFQKAIFHLNNEIERLKVADITANINKEIDEQYSRL